MIQLDKFLACVQENADRVHAYESGHDGNDGKCDCICQRRGHYTKYQRNKNHSWRRPQNVTQ